jgi:hypothetical protein
MGRIPAFIDLAFSDGDGPSKLKLMKRFAICSLLIGVSFGTSTCLVRAWDYEGHRIVNELALSALPSDYPAFVREPAAAERVAFLSGEPDRWRNVQDLQLRHCNGPDHYIDLEQLDDYGIKADSLPVFRYDFVAQLALARQAHPEKFAKINSERNEDHTRQLVGLLPWTIAEHYSRLKSAFSYLKALEKAGTPEEIANAKANVIYLMGIMGHYVGDAGQPLHTTIHHHGWVGENPHEYSTNSRIHGWIDGGFFNKVHGANFKLMSSQLRPAKTLMLQGREARPIEMFEVALDFILAQQKQVEPLYKLEKAGKLSGNGQVGVEGRPFLEGQLVKAAQLLADYWYSAWQQAPPDSFLESQLARRHQDERNEKK